MNKKCERNIQLDAMTLCCIVKESTLLESLIQLEDEEIVDFGEFKLVKVRGRYFENVFAIRFFSSYENKEINHGCLKFNKASLVANNPQTNLVWISVENRMLYASDFKFLKSITQKLNLQFKHYTHLDLCLDTNTNIARKVKHMFTSEDYDVILNRKKIKNNEKNRPEISFHYYGSRKRALKNLTFYAKQRSALVNKNEGITVTSYNKKAEIEDVSHKNYILDFYENPKKLYRNEVRLNREEIKTFLNSHNIIESDFSPNSMSQNILEEMFFFFFDSVIHFKKNRKIIGWKEILGK